MNRKSVFMIGSLLALSIAPVSTIAESRQAGLEACVDALVLQFADEGRVPMNFRVDPESVEHRGQLGQRETFHLDARDAKSGAILARADCTVNSRAKVRSLKAVPLNADDARKRALSL